MDIVQFITLLIISVITLFNYFRYGDFLYPPVLQGGVWLLITTMFILNQDMFIRTSNILYFVIMSGVVTFSIGSYLATWEYRVQQRPIKINDIKLNNAISQIFFWTAIIGLPFFIRKAYFLGTNGQYGNLFINLRSAVTGRDDSGGYGMLVYLVTISFLSAWLQLLVYFQSKNNKIKLLISYAVAIAYAFFSTGRTFFMLLFMTTYGILLITRKVSFIKSFFYFVLIGLIIFIGIGILLGKGVNLQDNPLDITMKMYDIFKVYFLGSLPAFDSLIRQDFSPELGLNTFRTLFAILSKFIDDVTVLPSIQEFVLVPMPTNVYTIYQPYYRDFGLFGVLGIQFIFGIWHGFLYKKATIGKPYYIFLYALFLYPLSMQFFADQYLSLLSMWIQYMLLSFIIFHSIKLLNSTLE
jgi:oligosaccharide repeat unit polymerase